MRQQDYVQIAVLKIDRIWSTIRLLIKCATWIAVAYLFTSAIGQFAGRTTDLNVLVSVTLSALADVKFVLSLSAAGLASAWALVERRLRHKKAQNLHGRVKQLETMIDPNRSSSGLTTEGRTNPEDIK